ncbi:MAG: hypothetical protein IPL71_14895 [Anaerolineales bacterium]|uniref:hypothetical protein n=1 Tax=Candidatus Villigracilis proximus TaxID=3140683 RepID=UPI0031354869|nr:hypothetical protein [Anaerolineales bacterium]
MKKNILIVFVIFTVFVSSGCTQELAVQPSIFTPYPTVENPMDMIQRFAKETAAAQTLIAGGTFETPLPTMVSPQNWAFVVIGQNGDIFGVDDDFISTLAVQSILVEGTEYRGVTLFDVLSSVGSVNFGVNEIEIHGNSVFVYEFDQISNQSLNAVVLVQNLSGDFDMISLSIPQENWVSNVKVIRTR